jgi:hypothetical protein
MSVQRKINGGVTIALILNGVLLPFSVECNSKVMTFSDYKQVLMFPLVLLCMWFWVLILLNEIRKEELGWLAKLFLFVPTTNKSERFRSMIIFAYTLWGIFIGLSILVTLMNGYNTNLIIRNIVQCGIFG